MADPRGLKLTRAAINRMEGKIRKLLKNPSKFTREEINEAVKKTLTTSRNITWMDIAIGAKHSSQFCERCGSCCKSPVRLVPEDVQNIAAFLKLPIKRFCDEYVSRTEDGYSCFKYHSKNEPCPFLINDKKCTIYSVRPIVCRTYPFNKEPSKITILSGCKAWENLVTFKALTWLILKTLPTSQRKRLEAQQQKVWKSLQNKHEGDTISMVYEFAGYRKKEE